jgi:hypothetical protein
MYSLTILIIDFLKNWGLNSQSLEETIQDLEDSFSVEGFDLDPIKGLRETLLPYFFETTLERQKFDDNSEEIFECLKENTEEDYKFCEQLIKICPNKYILVKFHEEREEEYDTIVQNYEASPTLKSVWEVSIA